MSEMKTTAGYLSDLQELLRKLSPMITSLRVSEEILRGDMEMAKAELKKVKEEIETLKAHKNEIFESNNALISSLKDREKEVMKTIHERNAKSIQLADSFKKLMDDIDKKQYQKLKEESQENYKAA